jgi:DMSO/TMAO reductase YedYZ heme-binding membrane subunit
MAIDINLRGPLAGLLTFLPGYDIFLNLGKLAFVLVSVGVIVGYFRTKPFLRKNWRKLHIMSYFAFVFVSIHSWNLGSDVKSFPFVITYFVGHVIVGLVILEKIYFFAKNRLGEHFQAPKSPQESE